MDFYSSTSLSFMVLHCFHCEIAVFVLPDYSSIPDNSEMYYGPVQCGGHSCSSPDSVLTALSSDVSRSTYLILVFDRLPFLR